MEKILKYFPELDDVQIRQLSLLQPLYEEWNQRINVISRKDLSSLYEKHVLHSLAIAFLLNIPTGASVMDLGTGGGFPGIPLAIYFPEVKFHLVDSVGKKIRVVQEIVSAVGLSNVTAQQMRAENTNGSFDFIVSRAVAPLRDLWTWSKPLLAKRGQKATLRKTSSDHWSSSDDLSIRSALVCLKGGNLKDEIRESGTRPMTINISEIFSEAFFQEKYIIVVS